MNKDETRVEMSDIQKVLKTLEMSEAIAERCVLTCVDCGNLNEHIYNLNQRIAELEAQQRWIPVSERLPEVDQDVLVFDQRGDITIDYLVALNREGVAYYTNSDDGAVCWMPLPEPPIVYGKDSKPLPCPFCGEIVKECNDVATPIDVALRKRIAELEGKIDQLTAHSDIERQDDKSSNDTQKETFVYG